MKSASDPMELVKVVGASAPVTHSCPECKSAVKCEIAQGKNTCWCFNVQARNVEWNDVCLCKKCLTNN
ncbi:hypothetical protein D3C85_173260 [compost metagenome]